LNLFSAEEWRPVVGYEDHYEVSDFGRVRNLYTERKLKPRCVRYPHVALYKHGKITEHTVHRLVLAAFVGLCPEGMQGLHKDDVKTNNRLTNLYYGTASQNQKDSRANGRQGRGPQLPNGHAGRVKDLAHCGVSFTQIGAYLNINRNIILRILENRHRYG
jgi:hypothetical protein